MMLESICYAKAIVKLSKFHQAIPLCLSASKIEVRCLLSWTCVGPSSGKKNCVLPSPGDLGLQMAMMTAGHHFCQHYIKHQKRAEN